MRLISLSLLLLISCVNDNSSINNEKQNDTISSSLPILSSSSVLVQAPIIDTSIISCRAADNFIERKTSNLNSNKKPASKSKSTCPINLSIIVSETFLVDDCLYQVKRDGVVIDNFESSVINPLPSNCNAIASGAFDTTCVLKVTYCSTGYECGGYIKYSENVSSQFCQ